MISSAFCISLQIQSGLIEQDYLPLPLVFQIFEITDLFQSQSLNPVTVLIINIPCCGIKALTEEEKEEEGVAGIEATAFR